MFIPPGFAWPTYFASAEGFDLANPFTFLAASGNVESGVGGGTDATVVLSGSAASGAVGAVGVGSGTKTVLLTGIAATSDTGVLFPTVFARTAPVTRSVLLGAWRDTLWRPALRTLFRRALAPALSGGTNRTVTLTGVAATGALGTVSVNGSQSRTVTLAGRAVAGAIGTVTVQGTQSRAIALTGFATSGALGAVLAQGTRSRAVSLTGLAALSATGVVFSRATVSVTFTGTSVVTVSPRVRVLLSVLFLAGSAFAVTPGVRRSGSVTFTGTATLRSAIQRKQVRLATTLQGTSMLTIMRPPASTAGRSLFGPFAADQQFGG